MQNPVLARLADKRENVKARITDLMDSVEADERDLSEAEQDMLGRHKDELVKLDAQISDLADWEDAAAAGRDVRAIVAAPREAPGRIAATTPVPGPAAPYRTFAQFAWDSLLVKFPEKLEASRAPGAVDAARERINAAVANTLLADIPGILPPQHLAQIFDVITTARPAASSGRQITLTAKNPTYPKITQRPTVGVQATEKTEGASQKMTVALQTMTTATYMGVGDLSWQDIQFSSPSALQLWFDLCAAEYARVTEAATCAGIVAGATAGPALPTVTPPATLQPNDFYTAIAKAAGTVASGTGAYPDTIYASSNVGYYLAGLMSAQQRTFGPAGSVDLASGGGNIGGLRLVTSMGFAAGTIVVANAGYLLVGETAAAPERLQAVEASIGGIQTGIIGQFGFALTDPLAFVKITGGPTTLEEESPS